MKKHLKWLKRLVIALVVLVVAGGLGLGWLVGRLVTEDGVVAAVEEELNARVELGELEIRPWGMPARVVLRDLKLAPRDAWVGKPLAERPRLETAPVEVGEVRLAVSLGPLLKRRIEVKEFVFEKPRVAVTVFEDGGNSLELLFESPDRPKRKKKRERKGGGVGGALNVHEVGMLAQIEGVAIRNGIATVTIEKSGLVVSISDWTMELDQIEVDPEALETMNTARMRLSGGITMDAKNGERLGYLHIDGPAEARLFDPRTGNFALEFGSDLRLSDDSYLSARVPAVDEAWRKLQKLTNLGLDLGGIPERAHFGRSQSVAVRYGGGRVTVEKPLSMWFGDWELALLEGAWVQTGESTHAAAAELLASAKVSALLKRQLDKALSYVPKEVRPEVVAGVENLWFRDGRLVAELVSTGDLSDPDVTILNKYPDLKKIIKEAGETLGKEKLKDLGGSLLKKLFDDDE